MTKIEPLVSKRPRTEVRAVISPPPVSLRAAQKELLLQRVHDAARELFYSPGFNSTTMDQIAFAAGLQRSTIYKYFRDKEDILSMIAERYGDRLLEVVATLPGPEPSRAQIDAWMQAATDFIVRERTPTALIHELSMIKQGVEPMTLLATRIVGRLAKNVTAFRVALEPGPKQARAYAWAMLIMRDICLNALRQAPRSDDPVSRGLFVITGDLVETFLREQR